MSGTTASEMDETETILRNEYYSDIMYVFNFVSEREKKDVLEFMENKAERTFLQCIPRINLNMFITRLLKNCFR